MLPSREGSGVGRFREGVCVRAHRVHGECAAQPAAGWGISRSTIQTRRPDGRSAPHVSLAGTIFGFAENVASESGTIPLRGKRQMPRTKFNRRWTQMDADERRLRPAGRWNGFNAKAHSRKNAKRRRRGPDQKQIQAPSGVASSPWRTVDFAPTGLETS